MLESKICTISVGSVFTQSCLYFAEGKAELYLSPQVCKVVDLVPHNPNTRMVMSSMEWNPPHILTKDNVDLLERWLLEYFWCNVFAVNCAPLSEMQGPPYHLHDTQILAVHASVSVPHHFHDEVKQQL